MMLSADPSGAAIDTNALVALTRSLLQVPSEQSALFEDDPAVQRFVRDTVAPILAQAGYPGRFDAMGNLLVEAGPREGGPAVMVMGYAMTHPGASMVDPFSGAIVDRPEGLSLRGRGAAEQKGALAAAIVAFLAAQRLSPDRRRILAVSTAGETGSHRAAESMLAALGEIPAHCIVAIGTGGRISLANKGRLDVHIDVRGVSSHSSTPWAGVDAIAGARAVMDRLSRLDLGGRRHPLLGEATLSFTAIRSFPEATHTIQDHVRITCDRRLLPGDESVPALSAIRDAVRDMPPWSVDVQPGVLQYPAEIAPDGSFMRAAREGSQRVGLPTPETFASHGCVDTGYLARKGCESAMWGPGEQRMWHTAEESVLVADLVSGTRGYLGFLLAAGPA